MTATAPATQSYAADSYGLPEDTAPRGIRCGNHPLELRVRHENSDAVRACYEISRELSAQQRDEIYAEAVMSWVCGGGNPEDASRYAFVIASGEVWDGGIGPSPMTGELCDHGLDAGLCCGPQHYPPDM